MQSLFKPITIWRAFVLMFEKRVLVCWIFIWCTGHFGIKQSLYRIGWWDTKPFVPPNQKKKCHTGKKSKRDSRTDRICQLDGCLQSSNAGTKETKTLSTLHRVEPDCTFGPVCTNKWFTQRHTGVLNSGALCCAVFWFTGRGHMFSWTGSTYMPWTFNIFVWG